MSNTPTTSSTDDSLRAKIDKLLSSMQVEEYGTLPQPQTLDAIMQLIRQDREAREAEAVGKELDRLNGFLEFAELCENDLDRMLTWVKNAKWSLQAPKDVPKASPPDSKAKA